MKKQTILSGFGIYQQLDTITQDLKLKNPLLVCGHSFDSLPCHSFVSSICNIRFSKFAPNPTYDSVCEGVRLFQTENCDAIIAIGGGSAMDVAKCIKLFSTLNPLVSYLEQNALSNSIPLIALPTTAGTGSESTHFAVIYKNGEKQSVHHDSILPDIVLLDSSSLSTLPLYQKKCAMLDALCQAIESMWSVKSTEESIALSQKAIPMILENMDAYLENTSIGNENMLLAANLAGQAINITQTTAPHAMSYKLTSLYGIPHGHAVALCLPHVWRYMMEHLEDCTDERGKEWVEDIFLKIAITINTDNSVNAVSVFEDLLTQLNVRTQLPLTEAQVRLLSDSVNIDRLKNSPVFLSRAGIYDCYLLLSISYV